MRRGLDLELFRYRHSAVLSETFASVVVQFRALGMIAKARRKRAVSDNASYWALTDKGERYLISILAKKKREMPSNCQVTRISFRPNSLSSGTVKTHRRPRPGPPNPVGQEVGGELSADLEDSDECRLSTGGSVP